MSRSISMNARVSHDAQVTDELEVALFKIEHPSLSETIRLSTDPTVRLSDDPLAYGTYSTWQTTDGSPFEFVLLSAEIPDEKEDLTGEATLTIDNVSNKIAQLFQAVNTRATVSIAVVLASTPNVVEYQALGLEISSVSGNQEAFTVKLSREALLAVPFPMDRMTKGRFPALAR